MHVEHESSQIINGLKNTLKKTSEKHAYQTLSTEIQAHMPIADVSATQARCAENNHPEITPPNCNPRKGTPVDVHTPEAFLQTLGFSVHCRKNIDKAAAVVLMHSLWGRHGFSPLREQQVPVEL